MQRVRVRALREIAGHAAGTVFSLDPERARAWGKAGLVEPAAPETAAPEAKSRPSRKAARKDTDDD